jgi:replicative DNA helicase
VTDLYDPPPVVGEDEPALDRTPPQDLDAEQSVLGDMMLSKDAITVVDEILNGSEYYRPAHGMIHRAILALYGRGEPADPITVAAELEKADDLARVGGKPYLHTCVSATPTAANADWHAARVLHKAERRKIIETGAELVRIGYQAPTSVEALDQSAGLLQQLTASSTGRGYEREKPLRSVLKATMDDYHAGEGIYLPLPYKDLHEKVPVEPGDFVIVAGTPGTGKTTVLADMARCVAIKHGMRAYIGSMEMPHTQIGQRILCAEARVDLNRFRKRLLSQDELARVEQARERIQDCHLIVDDSTAVPVSRMRARLRQWQAAGELPDLYIIDYLQIAKAEEKAGMNRTNAVDQLARDMRNLALDFGIIVVAAAQLNRKVSDRPDKVPQLSDLRESSALEQSCTIAWLLDRLELREPETDRAGEMDIYVAKNRMGSTGIVTVAYQGHYCRAVDMAAGH